MNLENSLKEELVNDPYSVHEPTKGIGLIANANLKNGYSETDYFSEEELELLISEYEEMILLERNRILCPRNNHCYPPPSL